MKKEEKKSNSGIIVVIFVVIVFGFIVYFVGNINKIFLLRSKTVINNLKTYTSEEMKFSIHIPSKFQVEDLEIKLILSYYGKEISMIRNGTNYDNLTDYLVNFDKKRNLVVSEVKRVLIDGKDVLVRMLEFPEEKIKQKAYYVYVDNWVYILSTSSEDLYGDLDQIVQSFRYMP